jgi:DNA-binding MarR family transcriptional regulator
MSADARIEPSALAEALRPGLMRVARRLRQEAQKAGVSALDALVLGQVRRHVGVGVCELADAEQMSRPAMSGHVKRLVAAGWISRADHAEDGRRSGLAVTEAGELQLETIRRYRNDWLGGRIARLSPDDQRKLSDAAGALDRLLGLEP